MKREIILYLIVITLCWIFCSGTFVLSSIDNLDSIKRILPPEAIMVNKDIVKSSGLDPNDIEDLKLAAMEDNEYVTKANNFILREAAISLLVYKTGKESIPVLKTSLNDSHPYIRCTAAKYLSMFDDKSGLGRMRKDMEELTKDDEEYEKIYNESYGKKKTMLKSFRTKNGRLRYALEAALVLAENGDMSGFKLAAQEAIEDKNKIRKKYAIQVLMALAFIDDEKLEANGVFPGVIILDVAEKEKDPFLIHQLIGFARNTKKQDLGIKILEILQQSGNLSQEQQLKVDVIIKEKKKFFGNENKLDEK